MCWHYQRKDGKEKEISVGPRRHEEGEGELRGGERGKGKEREGKERRQRKGRGG